MCVPERFVVAIEDEQEASEDPIEALLANKYSVRIGTIPVWPFTGNEGSFLDGLTTRFALLSGLKADQVTSLAPSNVREELVASGGVHLVAGWLRTIERARDASFFVTPIRVALNGVFLARTLRGKQIDHLRAVLAVQTSGPVRIEEVCRPIVQREELGHIYVTQTLRVASEQIIVSGTPSLSANIKFAEFAVACYILLYSPHIVCQKTNIRFS